MAQRSGILWQANKSGRFFVYTSEMMKRRRHSARTFAAALAIFATAAVGGTLHAAMASDPVVTASAYQPTMIHETGTARFVTTDTTGMVRFITTDTPRSPFRSFLDKIGLGKRQTVVLTGDTVNAAKRLGVATVSDNDDGTRTLTVRTPSEWVFALENE
jgi:cation transport ATPase